mgnify:CR=1 FL=1
MLVPHGKWDVQERGGERMEKKSNGAAVASLVLGIIGLCTGWLYGLGCILGIISVVMSAKSKKENGGSGVATAGLVLGILAIVFGAVWLACSICGSAAICASM